MGCRAILLLLAVQAVSLSLQPRTAAGDWLTPIVSPSLKGVCNAVDCARGSCRVDGSRMFGYVCECDDGWTKTTLDGHFQYLPCVIPNCTLNYSCSNITMAPPSSLPPLPSSNNPIFDACLLSQCGEGTCVKTSAFGYRCDCKPEYANILNSTILPCLKECALGEDCARLGIRLPNGSLPSTSTSSQPAGEANRVTAATRPPGSLMWILLLMLSVAIAPRL